MDESRAPTLEDLAQLIQAASGDPHFGTVETARWLIEESAAELHSELVAKSGDEPSPLELARLLSAVTSDWGIPEALDAARWLIAQSEVGSAHLSRLEQLAADAGTSLETFNHRTVLDHEHDLDRLLEAVDDWLDPSDVLDPTRKRGVDFRALYRLCCARIAGRQGEARRQLETVRDRLERPSELERLLPSYHRRFEFLQQWLVEVGDPEAAADSLEEMGRLLRSALAPPGR